MESLEVVSIAAESARDTTGESLRSAWRDSLEYFREAPLSAPLRCVANNTRITFRLLTEVADISRETLDDLARSGLPALQAALGAGLFGYALGNLRGRRTERERLLASGTITPLEPTVAPTTVPMPQSPEQG